MNSINSFSGFIQPALAGDFISALSNQQKTIIKIAVAIFSCILTGYLIHQYFIRPQIESAKEKLKDYAEVHLENHPKKEHLLEIFNKILASI